MTGPEMHISTVAQVIQLSVAPVFLLSGVGIILTVLTNRLSRVVERARSLEESTAGTDHSMREWEIQVLARRARLMNRAITLSTVCALLIALVVVALFVDAFTSVDLSRPIALMFVFAMISLIIGLLMFLREVFLAISALRIGVRKK
jgi:hypothetical protein